MDGFEIPGLVDWDESLWVVEMEIVVAPCIVDFGKAYLDRPPEYFEGEPQDWEAAQRELWGDKLEAVKWILWQLERIGIYYRADAKPGNIIFEDQWQSDDT